jgi:hypothetical protein
MGKKSRRSTTVSRSRDLSGSGPIPVVGGREPCPCGSGKRYKGCHGRAGRQEAVRLVSRPFSGLSGECDWIAMREIIPAATAVVRTTPEAGDREVTVATVLPMTWAALRRTDGSVILGLQTTGGSGDPSRDIADALLRALDAEPGTSIGGQDLPGPGPRLQDLLVPGRPFDVTVHPGFDFWLLPDQEVSVEARDSIERANAEIIPTSRLSSVDAAYWCRVGDRCHLRWIMPLDESRVLDGLARLHAAGNSNLVDEGRYVGSFRVHGLLAPVWDLPVGIEPKDLEEPAKEFEAALEAAMAVEAPLTDVQRRARAGVLSRQVTLR